MHLRFYLQYRRDNVQPIVEKYGYSIQSNVEVCHIDGPRVISEPVLCAVGILDTQKQTFAIECLHPHIDKPLIEKKYALSQSVVFYKNSEVIMAGGIVNSQFSDEV